MQLKTYLIESGGVFIVRAEDEAMALEIARMDGANDYHTCRELDLTQEGLIYKTYKQRGKTGFTD